MSPASARREGEVSDTIRAGTITETPTTVLDDRYELLHLLGAGGMGLVYAARHRVLRTRLAVKIVRSSDGMDVETVERFRREARAASAIGHPGIVDVRDFGTTPDGRAYLVMEQLDGRDLQGELEREAPLSPVRVARIGAQIAAALGAAHEHGVVHRDLKPENVFLLEGPPGQDTVKVLDFGIAKFSELPDRTTGRPSSLALRITAFGQLIGTPAYMSPEQCSGSDLGPASDIYSLGVMLFEMCTGSLPFDAPAPLQIVRMHRETPPPALAEIDPSLPAALVAVIERCLAKRPEERPRSMGEVESALRAIAGEPSGVRRLSSSSFSDPSARSTPTPPSVSAALPIPQTRLALPKVAPRRSRRAWWLGGGALAVALLGLGTALTLCVIAADPSCALGALRAPASETTEPAPEAVRVGAPPIERARIAPVPMGVEPPVATTMPGAITMPEATTMPETTTTPEATAAAEPPPRTHAPPARPRPLAAEPEPEVAAPAPTPSVAAPPERERSIRDPFIDPWSD